MRILVISWDVHCKFELIIEITFHNVSSTITNMINHSNSHSILLLVN